MAERTFESFSVASCGTLHPELNALRDEGFLDADRVLFTAPGLHEWPGQLEKQFTRQIGKARETSERVIVAYGERCFVDVKDPRRDTDALVREQGPGVTRVDAGNCVDMPVEESLRGKIAAADKRANPF